MDIFKYYEIDKNKFIGTGVNSIVYLGKDKKKKRNVAIKKITRMGMNDNMLKKLEREIKIMNIIKKNPHENIITCYDVIDDGMNVFIIMEYCFFGDLSSIIGKPIREVWVQYYINQLIEALKHLDKHNILHRDIKPKNILLSNYRKTLKLADFGLSKLLTKDMELNTLCGSPLYMAPEIIKKKGNSTRSDIWSIGIITYELLFGHHPLNKCEDFRDLINKLFFNKIEIPPYNNKNKISNECIILLNNLLQKDPNNRISWNDLFNNKWINKINIKDIEDIPVRVNSSDSLLSLEKKNNEDDELEHSKYSITNIESPIISSFNIIDDYIGFPVD